MAIPSSPHIAVVLVAMVTISLWPGVSATVGGGGTAAPGTLGPTLVPGQPYSVVWNYHYMQLDCFRQRGPYNFTDYGILENSNHELIGDRVAYLHELGEWPELVDTGYPETWINGGLPQLANVTKHLELARRHIDQLIPDPNFDGLGVIEMLNWSPLFYYGTWDARYQSESIARVRLQYPDWPTARVEEEAARQYETAARELLEQTLLLAREMRPRGRWGYFNLPHCQRVDYGECEYNAVIANDRLQWLYNISTALYPVLGPLIIGRAQRGREGREYIMATVREGFRVLEASGSRDTLLLPYTGYLNMIEFVNQGDVDRFVRMPADMGAAGVVVHGVPALYSQSEYCDHLQIFLTQYLGPLAERLVQSSRTCSNQVCKGHGRCVRMCVVGHPYAAWCTDLDMCEPAFAEPFNSDYACSCYPGWTEYDCTEPA